MPVNVQLNELTTVQLAQQETIHTNRSPLVLTTSQMHDISVMMVRVTTVKMIGLITKIQISPGVKNVCFTDMYII